VGSDLVGKDDAWKLSQKSGGSPNRATIRVDKFFVALTPTLSQRERDRVRVHLWHVSGKSMIFETLLCLAPTAVKTCS